MTIGDASVSPYPSSISTPNRSCIAANTDSGRREAPDNARRTLANASAGTSVELGERGPHARGAGDDGDAAVGDRLQRGGRVEPLHEHHGRADRQREAEHDVQAEDVEHRQHAVHDVVAVHVSLGAQALLDVGAQVAVGQHRRAWCARGSAGEEQHGEMVGVHIDPLDGFRLEQPVERDQVAVGGGRPDRW